MFDDDKSTLSITGVDTTVSDIYEYAKKINEEISNISSIITKTSEYYNTPDGYKFREKYEKFNNDTQSLKKDILSIATDLVNVKGIYKKSEKGAVQIIQDAELNMKKKLD